MLMVLHLKQKLCMFKIQCEVHSHSFEHMHTVNQVCSHLGSMGEIYKGTKRNWGGLLPFLPLKRPPSIVVILNYLKIKEKTN